jgi:predicted nucleic acid-binding Zn ribbon protein
MTRAGRPSRIGEVLRAMLEKSGLDERIAETSVVPEWEDRVGKGIAAVTTPLRVSNGTLVVSVRSSAWLAELQMMERQILERVNTGRSQGRVRRIRFVMRDGDDPGNEGGNSG